MPESSQLPHPVTFASHNSAEDLFPNWPVDPYRYSQDALTQSAITIDFSTCNSFWPQASNDLDLFWLEMPPAPESSRHNIGNLLDPVSFEQSLLQLSASITADGTGAAQLPFATNTGTGVDSALPDNFIQSTFIASQGNLSSYFRQMIPNQNGLSQTLDADSGTSSDSSSTAVQQLAATNTDNYPNATEANRCPHGCPKPFRRPGDYRRHMRKHEKPRFKCPDIDCDKTFYRADKLRDHLRQGHKGLNL